MVVCVNYLVVCHNARYPFCTPGILWYGLVPPKALNVRLESGYVNDHSKAIKIGMIISELSVVIVVKDCQYLY